MQFIYRYMAMIRSWSPLQRVEHRGLFTEVSTRLEASAMDFFSYMDDNIIFGSALRLFRRFYNFSL